MTAIQFLLEWALRSSVLILSGTLLLWALRVKDPSIRLAASIAMLCASLAIPPLALTLPRVPLAAPPVARNVTFTPPAAIPVADSALPASGTASAPTFDWTRAALMLYSLVTLALLLRLTTGLAMSLRLRRASLPTGRTTEGIEIRESPRVPSPVTLGVFHPAIVLPADWSNWDRTRLEAILAHERSHILRRDPAVQLLSAIHRALLWHSPLSWILHRRIVRIAEEVSDDAAIAQVNDRASYAQTLLDFMQRGARGASWQAVPMARYGLAEERIHRILDATQLSRGLSRRSLAAILALVSPLAYIAAAAHPQSVAQSPAPVVLAPPVQAQAAPAEEPYIRALGSVTPSNTVTIKPRVDGQLMSIAGKEGGRVRAGQLVASIDPRPFQLQLNLAEAQLQRDQAQRLESAILADQANVENARLQLTYTNITAPIDGIIGLRLLDPGNMVHAADSTGILVITQLQPIAVLFNIPEDKLPEVRGLLQTGASPLVQAWNRDASAMFATGRLIAVDNQIDINTGLAKLKAIFDNKDEALFPNQFVNVRLFLR